MHLASRANDYTRPNLDKFMDMPSIKQTPTVLDSVALLENLPEQRLHAGQVGTVVDVLDGGTVLVEFSDDQGRGYAVTPCSRAALLVLHYAPEAV